ncbi:unnamed protein product, partial [Laminaria digitata]
ARAPGPSPSCSLYPEGLRLTNDRSDSSCYSDDISGMVDRLTGLAWDDSSGAAGLTETLQNNGVKFPPPSAAALGRAGGGGSANPSISVNPSVRVSVSTGARGGGGGGD